MDSQILQGQIKVGDKGMFQKDTYRGIIAFDTQDIPVGASVKSAVLSLYRQSQTGTISSLSLDIKQGTSTFNLSLLTLFRSICWFE
jgi:hypothetical protein